MASNRLSSVVSKGTTLISLINSSRLNSCGFRNEFASTISTDRLSGVSTMVLSRANELICSSLYRDLSGAFVQAAIKAKKGQTLLKSCLAIQY